MTNDDNNKYIPVPVERILHESMQEFNCDFDLEFQLMFRRFLIAGLNLHYYTLADLINLTDRLCEKIQYVSYEYEIRSGDTKHYAIEGDTLYLSKELHKLDEYTFETSVFAAFYEILTCAYEYPDYEFVKVFLSYMAAERFQQMDEDEGYIKPEIKLITIANETYRMRSGYRNCYNLYITLLQQAFRAWKMEDDLDSFFLDSLTMDLGEAIYYLPNDNGERDLAFTSIEMVYLLRCLKDDEQAFELIKRYQMYLNSLFDNPCDMNYFLFKTQIISDECRKECEEAMEKRLKKIKDESEGFRERKL